MKIKLITAFICLLFLFSGCTEQNPVLESTDPPIAEPTLIPRETLPPEDVEGLTTVTEFKSGIEPMIAAWENALNGRSCSSMKLIEDDHYCYAFTTTISNQGIYGSAIYRLDKDENGYSLSAYGDAAAVGNEYTYEMVSADFGDETVFYTMAGMAYFHPDGSSEAEVGPYGRTGLKTTPTKFSFLFSDDTTLNYPLSVKNNYLFFSRPGQVRIKELEVYADDRALTDAFIHNYVVPEPYHIYEAKVQKVQKVAP